MVLEALRKHTSNGWEDRRVLGSKTEEVNDSDSLKCSSSYVTGRGVGKNEEPGDEGKRQEEGRGRLLRSMKAGLGGKLTKF